jgi:flagella basal body P-ring formation protein FlgA
MKAKTIGIILVGLCLVAVAPFIEAGAVTRKDVRANQSSISDACYQKAFKSYICRRLNKKASDVVVSKLKINGEKPISGGNVTLKLYQRDQRPLNGQVRLTALVIANGTEVNRVDLTGWVDVFDFVVSATRNMKKGETISANDVRLVRKNISRLSDDVVTDIDKALDRMTRRGVREGQDLKEWMLMIKPVVDRGDLVTIVAESPVVKVTVPGKIMKIGYPGEQIKVLNLMSNKAIFATVVDGSTVKIDF